MIDELKIVNYNHVHHIKHLYDWFKFRLMDMILIDELPSVGCIATYKDLGVCAGFLRMVEPNYALLDSLITNPEALPPLRNEAIDECVQYLIKKAKDLKLKSLIAYTDIPGIVERSKKHGFKKLPDSVICLNLREEVWDS